MIPQSIRRLFAKPAPPEPVEPPPLRPIEYGPRMRAEIRTIKRLEHLYTLGAHFREQAEAAAHECCILLGVDPNAETLESDSAKDIVLVGRDVSHVIQAISDSRAARKHLRATGELSDGD